MSAFRPMICRDEVWWAAVAAAHHTLRRGTYRPFVDCPTSSLVFSRLRGLDVEKREDDAGEYDEAVDRGPTMFA